jgi:formamidopyrimidine-DNA glycosylase
LRLKAFTLLRYKEKASRFMPELPEVESFRKLIERSSLRQKISAVKLVTDKVLQDTSTKKLTQALLGKHFSETHRHGKFLFVRIADNGSLMLHFALSGYVSVYRAEEEVPDDYTLLIRFENESALTFTDKRKLGKIAIIDDVDTFVKKRGYGPDALTIAETALTEKLKKRKVAIKTALMDQKIVAGVGNEYSDEILFQCGIHPESVSAHLPPAQLKAVYKAMIGILKHATKYNAERNHLGQFFFLDNRKAGMKCPNCHGKTAFKTIGGRSSYFCPKCQKIY